MKTKTLKISPNYDFILFGITSTDDDYRLSWQIANKLKIEIERSDDLSINNEKLEEPQTFSIYEGTDHRNNFIIKVVSNKSSLGYLIEELKNIDFFIIIKENDDTVLINKIFKSIRTINTVSSIFQIEIESLKSKEKLLF